MLLVRDLTEVVNVVRTPRLQGSLNDQGVVAEADAFDGGTKIPFDGYLSKRSPFFLQRARFVLAMSVS
jgi:hypothetical protein